METEVKKAPLGPWETRIKELTARLDHPDLSERERVKMNVHLQEAQGIVAMVNKYDPMRAIERANKSL